MLVEFGLTDPLFACRFHICQVWGKPDSMGQLSHPKPGQKRCFARSDGNQTHPDMCKLYTCPLQRLYHPFFFCSTSVISTTLFSSLLICSFLPSNPLLIHTVVFFIILIIVFFKSLWFFFIFSNFLLNSSHKVIEHLYYLYLEVFMK